MAKKGRSIKNTTGPKINKDKFAIIAPFVYKGEDGRSKKHVTLAPGEDVPKLDSNEMDRLLADGKIARLNEYGERMKVKDTVELDDKDIDSLSGANPSIIEAAVRGTKFSNEALAKLRIWVEKKNQPRPIIDMIDARIEGRI